MMNASSARDAHDAERRDERRQPHEHDQRRAEQSRRPRPTSTPVVIAGAERPALHRRTDRAATTPASAITAPGARSMPPEMITIAAPTAAMP